MAFQPLDPEFKLVDQAVGQCPGFEICATGRGRDDDRRRNIQLDYNKENGITPETIMKPVDMLLVSMTEADYSDPIPLRVAEDDNIDDPVKLVQRITEIEEEMREAARRFEFERAAELRDRAKALKERQLEIV